MVESILPPIARALEPGERMSFSDSAHSAHTMTFGGRTYHVQAFVGAGDQAVLLVQDRPVEHVNPAQVVSNFLNAAANVLVIGLAPGSDLEGVARAAQELLASHIEEIADKHRATMAARGRPS